MGFFDSITDIIDPGGLFNPSNYFDPGGSSSQQWETFLGFRSPYASNKSDEWSSGGYNVLGVPMSDPSYAAKTGARVAKQDWQIYQQYYQPLENYLFNMVNNPGYDASQISKNNSDFNNQFTAAQSTNQRDLGRYGLTMTAPQKQAYNRLQDESKALGQVNSINSTNVGLQNMEYSILGAGQSSNLQNIQQNNRGV